MAGPGHCNGADRIYNRSKDGDLAAVLAEYGPGKPGIPLDLMDTEQPTKWLRISKGHKYIVLINTDDKPVTVVVMRMK